MTVTIFKFYTRCFQAAKEYFSLTKLAIIANLHPPNLNINRHPNFFKPSKANPIVPLVKREPTPTVAFVTDLKKPITKTGLLYLSVDHLRPFSSPQTYTLVISIASVLSGML